MNARTLLIASLALNVVLAGWLASSHHLSSRPPGAPAPTGDGEVAPHRNEPARLPKRDRQTGHAVAQTGGAPVPVDWTTIESEDFKQYIANLRAVGCPEETIRDLIFAEVNKLYVPKLAALVQQPKRNYWEPEDSWGRRETPEKRQQRRDLEKEKEALLKELLGPDALAAARKQSGYDWLAQQYDWLPSEKHSAVEDLNRKFNELEQDFFAKTGGMIDSEAQKELNLLREQKRADLAKLLSPAELEQWDLRHSDTALNLRFNMAGFNPTEDEFKSLFRSRKAYEDEFGSGGSKVDRNDPAAVARWQEARKKRDEDMKAALGDQRFVEYERSKDYAWQDLSRLASRHELPRDAASQVWDIKQTAQTAAQDLHSNTALSDEQRKAGLKQIQDETQKAVAVALGEKAFKSYQQGGGYWMQGLGSRSSARTVTISGDGGTIISDQIILNAPVPVRAPARVN
jgi:hypothetical protein